MAKEIKAVKKLAIQAGKANPAPPVGTVLGPTGINMQEFCQAYNEKTKDRIGDIIPVEITIYDDRTYSFILKTPPASFLLKKAAGITKGAQKPGTEVVATIDYTKVKEIAESKFEDLNAYDIDNACEIIMGTARNMGIKIENIPAKVEVNNV